MRQILLVISLLLGVVFGPKLEASPAVLPDLKITPGVATASSVKAICRTRWGKDARHVTASMKRSVMQSYHFSASQCPSGKVEIDHLISRELGGADDVKNLWPECYEKPVKGIHPSNVKEWGAHKKDRLENQLHKEVCAGRLSLHDAQKAERNDWRKAYIRYFGNP